MFTGIVETTGTIKKNLVDQTNLELYIDSPISNELKVDQSVSHNGVCLTVVEIGNTWHRCTLIKETLDKTNFSALNKGDAVNLERCLKNNSRIDGPVSYTHLDVYKRQELIVFS